MQTWAAQLYLNTLSAGAVIEIITRNDEQLGQSQTTVRYGLALAFRAVTFWENLVIIKSVNKIICVFLAQMI